jgi:DNA-binding Lrp family transcriptional regulator
MVTAITLINIEPGAKHDVVDALAAIRGVSEVFSTPNHYDLIAITRSEDQEAVDKLITDHVEEVSGITETETLSPCLLERRLENLIGGRWSV